MSVYFKTKVIIFYLAIKSWFYFCNLPKATPKKKQNGNKTAN